MFLHDAGQARHEHIRDMADFWTEAVEVASVIPQERVSERVQQHAAEKGVPRFREETVVKVRSIPCERVQPQTVERMVGEQGGVIAVTETASQDQKLQLQWSRPSWIWSRLQERISERIGEQFGVVEVSKNSSQEYVEIVKIIPQEQMSEWTDEQIGGYRNAHDLWPGKCCGHKCPSAVFPKEG